MCAVLSAGQLSYSLIQPGNTLIDVGQCLSKTSDVLLLLLAKPGQGLELFIPGGQRVTQPLDLAHDRSQATRCSLGLYAFGRTSQNLSLKADFLLKPGF